jgi:hypothetical protein
MTIPKIIHHIAPKKKNKWHPVWVDCYDSWKVNFPEEEYEYILWNDSDDIDSFIKNEYPQYWKTYKNLPLHTQKIDFARIAIIHKYGGIYSDMDVYCYKNFYEDLVGKDCCLVECSDYDGTYDKDNEIVVNFLIASKPKNIFFKDLLEKTIISINSYDKKTLKDILSDNKKRNHYVIENCIIMMSKLYKNYDKRLIHILPKYNYNCSIFLFHKNKKIQHMFTGMWGKEVLKRMEKQRLEYIKETGKNISYVDYFNEQYKLKTGLDMNLFTYKP